MFVDLAQAESKHGFAVRYPSIYSLVLQGHVRLNVHSNVHTQIDSGSRKLPQSDYIVHNILTMPMDPEALTPITDLRVAARMKAGSLALDRISQGEDILRAFDYDSSAPDHVNDFMHELDFLAFDMYRSKIITQKGVAASIRLPHILLAGFSPLEACAADEVDLAHEATKMSVEPRLVTIQERYRASLIAPKFESIFGRDRMEKRHNAK